jgi:hypothetical protein
MNVSPVFLIQTSPPGAMIYALAEAKGEELFALLIREEPERVARLGKTVRVHTKTALIEQDGVGLVPLMVQIEDWEPFETWINYYQSQDGVDFREGRRVFRALTERDVLALAFYTPAEGRRIAVRNSLAPTMREIARRLQAMSPWTMRAFDAARDKLYARYPTVQDLWDMLT